MISPMGDAQSSGESGAGVLGRELRFPARVGVVFCALSLAGLILLSSAVVLTEYRVADDFRLVGQIDFSRALSYFRQTSGFGRNEYRPLVLLSFAWDNWVWGDCAVGYHLTNVLLHAGSSVLLLLVLTRLTGNLVLGFFSAVLFAFHPVHHSRIAWIAARDSSLCLLFLLGSWLLYLSTRTRVGGAGSTPRGAFVSDRAKRVVSVTAFLFSLMSYEGAVSFPFVLAAMELCLAPQPPSWTERIRQTGRRTAPYFFILALYITGWLLLFEGKIGAYDLDWTAAGILGDFYRLHYNLFYHIQHWLGLVYLLIGALVWRARRACGGLVGFAWLLIWLGYLPFLPIQGFANRFAFLSSIGAALFLGLCAHGIQRASKEQLRSALGSAVLLVGVAGYYGYHTGRRLQHWVAAGRIAETIPAQLKALRSSFPSNATLVFDQIPRMYGDAYVFVNGLRVAVREKYSEPLPQIVYYETPIEPSLREQLMQQKPTFHFRYLPEQERLVEISRNDLLKETAR